MMSSKVSEMRATQQGFRSQDLSLTLGNQNWGLGERMQLGGLSAGSESPRWPMPFLVSFSLVYGVFRIRRCDYACRDGPVHW